MKDKTIYVSAPGKVILFGEHAVVYGKTALATSLNLRTKLKLVEGSEDLIMLIVPSLKDTFVLKLSELRSLQSSVEPLLDRIQDVSSKLDEEVLDKIQHFINLSKDGSTSENLALLSFLYLLIAIYHKSILPRLTIQVDSDLPLGAGLGSSASYSACLAAALLANQGSIHPRNKGEGIGLSEGERELVNRWSLLAEVVVHGKPSGVDNSVVTYGKAIEFKSGKMLFVENMPELKILLADTRVSRSSKAMVTKVKVKHDKYPAIIDSIMDSIEEVTKESIRCLQAMTQSQSNPVDKHLNLLRLNELIDMNHGLLRCLGVSHESIERTLQVLQKHGLTAKLTGAGGGGCVFAVLPPDFPNDSLESVQSELDDMNFSCFESSIGASGVEINIK